jgi:hypothetical protein
MPKMFNSRHYDASFPHKQCSADRYTSTCTPYVCCRVPGGHVDDQSRDYAERLAAIGGQHERDDHKVGVHAAANGNGLQDTLTLSAVLRAKFTWFNLHTLLLDLFTSLILAQEIEHEICK